MYEPPVEQNPLRLSAVEFLDDNTYIGADDNFNLFVAARNPDAASEEVVATPLLSPFAAGGTCVFTGRCVLGF